MSQYDVDDLTGITSSTAGILAGQANSASDVKTWMDEAAADLANINTAIQAIATMQSGSTAPSTNRRGEIFMDTDDNRWLGDPDGSGHDDEFLTRLQAKNIDIATGGTATHKLMGAINVNTTASARTTAGDFAQTYTLPANTLDANGKLIRVTWWGTRSGAVGTFSLQPKLGTTNVGTAIASTINSLTDWMVQCLIIRTGVGTQDIFFHAVFNSDATGSTTLADFDGTQTEDETATLAITLDLTAISAGTVTQEGFLIELLQ